jgi:hypothetical protein
MVTGDAQYATLTEAPELQLPGYAELAMQYWSNVALGNGRCASKAFVSMDWSRIMTCSVVPSELVQAVPEIADPPSDPASGLHLPLPGRLKLLKTNGAG